jgi:hypothetical protein
MTPGAPKLAPDRQDIYLSLPCCNHIKLNGSLLRKYIILPGDTPSCYSKQYINRVHIPAVSILTSDVQGWCVGLIPVPFAVPFRSMTPDMLTDSRTYSSVNGGRDGSRFLLS